MKKKSRSVKADKRQIKKAKGPLSFFKEAKEELKKVTWPKKEELIKMTAVVITISLAVGLFIGLLDYIFISLTAKIIK